MTTLLRMPITNVFGQGDYSATLHLGSEKSPVNLLLDTGSSTLVVKSSAYQASLDKKLTASSAVQEVNYGVGGWNGPVIYTRINIHEHCQESAHLQNIAKSYYHLNNLRNTQQYAFAALNVDPFLNKVSIATNYFTR